MITGIENYSSSPCSWSYHGLLLIAGAKWVLKDVRAHGFHDLLICYACLISAIFEYLVGHGYCFCSIWSLYVSWIAYDKLHYALCLPYWDTFWFTLYQRRVTVNHVLSCMSVIVVITRRADCFHDLYVLIFSFPKSVQWLLRARALIYSKSRQRNYHLFSTLSFMLPIFS